MRLEDAAIKTLRFRGTNGKMPTRFGELRAKTHRISRSATERTTRFETTRFGNALSGSLNQLNAILSLLPAPLTAIRHLFFCVIARVRGEIIYAPPPPPPHFWPQGIFQGRGVGVYILRPHAAGILYAPPCYTPPTPRRVFSGVGGGGACIKFGPVESAAGLSQPRAWHRDRCN